LLLKLRDPNRHFVQPVQDFLYEQTLASQLRRDDDGDNDQQGRRRRSSRRGTLAGIVLLPSRMVKLSAASWLLGELICAFGGFEGDGKKKKNALYDSKHVKRARRRARNWWNTNIRGRSLLDEVRDVRSWSPKHQWTVGAGIGLVMSPALVPLSVLAVKVSFVAYVLGEINRNCYIVDAMVGTTSDNDIPVIIDHDDFHDVVEQWVRRGAAALERWTQFVNAAAQDPERALEYLRLKLLVAEYDFVGRDGAGNSAKPTTTVTPMLLRGFLSGAMIGFVAGV